MPTFETSSPIRASVELGFGTLSVTAAAASTAAAVQVLPSDPTSHRDVKAAERIQVEYAGGHLRITDPAFGSRAWLARPGSIEVVLDLPEGSHLDAAIETGDLRGEGRLGEVTVRSTHGEVRLDRAGTADVRAESGDIVINEVLGGASAETTYRDITIGSLGGAARLTSATGDITVERARDKVDACSEHGHVTIGTARRTSQQGS